jgi:hypothetical protein
MVAATWKTSPERKQKTKAWKDHAPVSAADKESLIKDLRQSMQDLWRLPRLLLAPVIAFIGAKRDKLPKERRESLQKIATTIKTSGKSGIDSLKEWFHSALTWVKNVNTPENKKKVEKALSSAKKTTRSTTSKLSTSAQKAAATLRTSTPKTSSKKKTTKQPLPKTTKQPLPKTTKQPLPKTTKQPLPKTTKQPLPKTTKQPLPKTTKQPLPKTTKQPLPKTTKQPTLASPASSPKLATRSPKPSSPKPRPVPTKPTITKKPRSPQKD